MCGIAGYILHEAADASPQRLRSLMDAIRLRGPDDEGVVLIDRRGRRMMAGGSGVADVAFLHARFSIIDLSSGGHQPFSSRDGECSLVFNGEIYNYLELRAELAAQGVVFRSSSDTEVLAEGWRVWGPKMWPKLNGFWAVAIYDRPSNSVVLCRDRLGVAPLYYRQTAEGFFFASLIGPLRDVAPGSRLNEDVLRGYIDTGLKDHDNSSCYADIYSLPPASSVTFAWKSSPQESLQRAHVYWKLPQRMLDAREIGLDEASDRFWRLLVDAVRLRLRADVPLAFELSGGLDSAAIIAAAAQLSDKRIRAYTIRVRGKDEGAYAAAVAARFNIDHQVLMDVEEDLPRDAAMFARIMEEPYDTPANYLHYQMLRRIRSDGFKVVLTGAGGDEVLAGYEADFWPAAWRAMEADGRWIQAQVYEFSRRFHTWPQGMATLAGYARYFVRMTGFGPRQGKPCPMPSSALEHCRAYGKMDFLSRRLYHFHVGLLPYYLRSSDHYTLNIPVEHRFPLLDYRLVELGVTVPPSYLFHGGWTKYMLRHALRARIPAGVVWRRKKMGFPFAFHSYFMGRGDQWRPYVQAVQEAGLCCGVDYDELARHAPERLWRILSVGVWLKSAYGEGA